MYQSKFCEKFRVDNNSAMDFPWSVAVQDANIPNRNRAPVPQNRRGFFGSFMTFFVGNDDEPAQRKPRTTPKVSSKYEISGDLEPNWKQLETNGVVCGVVLSLWDNISGPRVEQAWCCPGVPASLLLQSAPFTLNGEMITSLETESKEYNRIEQKLLVLPQYFSPSLIFCAKYNGQVSKFALSMIFLKECLDKYLRIHLVVKDRMMQLVEAYKKISENGNSEPMMSQFGELLNSLLKNLQYLFDVIPADPIVLPNGAPAPPYNFSKTILALETIDTPTKSFLVQVITSQLQTGSTLVIGNDEEEVKKWLYTLWLFLLPHQRHLARLATIPKDKNGYLPDLSLQGLVLQSSNLIEDDQIIGCLVPSTVVDIDQKVVKQTHPYHEYLVIHRDYQEEQRRRIAIMEGRPDNLWEAKEDLFRAVEAAPIVSEIIDRVFALPASRLYIREGFIAQSMVLLIRKTLVLMKYAEALGSEKKSPKDSLQHQHHNENGNINTNSGNPGTTGTTATATATPSDSVKNEPAKTITEPVVCTQNVVTSAQTTATPAISAPISPESTTIAHAPHVSASAPVTPMIKRHVPTNHSMTLAQSHPVGGTGHADVPEVSDVQHPPNTDVEPHETKRRITQDLHLKESCYFVLLGIAEKLQPGTFVQVAGNPAWIEEKLIDLFERF